MTRFERLLAVIALLGAIGFSTSSIAAARPPVLQPPTQPPARVVAVSGNAQVRLTWSPVQGATGYRVFRGAKGAWHPMPIATTSQTRHTSAGLENGTTYSFTVAAYTRAGAGPLSLVVSAMPLAPPASVTAIAGDKRVTIQWQPSAGATSYTVYRRTGAEPVFSALAPGVVAPPFVDPGLRNGVRYYYQLRAVSSATESAPTPTVSAAPVVVSRVIALRD